MSPYLERACGKEDTGTSDGFRAESYKDVTPQTIIHVVPKCTEEEEEERDTNYWG